MSPLPIILVHGVERSSKDWDACLPFLRGRVLLVPGLSPLQTTRPDLDAALALVLRLLTQERIERAHWVGNSLGGHLCLQAAIEHPEKAASVSLVQSLPHAHLLEKVRAPLFLLDSEEEPLYEKELQKKYRAGRLPHGGHLLPIDAPRELCAALLSFLEMSEEFSI